jgi:uncharacterized protein (DUF2267 family)
MSHASPVTLERASYVASTWLADVAREFPTDDMHFVQRVTRAWLHVVRDRLPLIESVHLGAQLPEFLRGIYYEGWDPAQVPMKLDRDELVERFATEAGIAAADVRKSAGAVSAAFDHRTGGHITVVLERFPADVRDVLRPPSGDMASTVSL